MEILQPPGWPRPRGYANGIAARGRLVFVAGQVGWDATETVVADDFVAQARQALANVVTVLAAGGAEPRHLARMTWYVTDRDAYLGNLRAIGRCYREIIGAHFPAMSAIVVAGLVEPGALVEIEATAVVPD